MRRVALALIHRGERWFLQRRDLENAVLPGLWEFPGGKAEGDENLRQTLEREVHEELGLILLKAEPWPVLEGEVQLHPFLAEVAGDPRTPLAWGWFTVEDMLKLPIPELNRALIERIRGARNFSTPRLI